MNYYHAKPDVSILRPNKSLPKDLVNIKLPPIKTPNVLNLSSKLNNEYSSLYFDHGKINHNHNIPYVVKKSLLSDSFKSPKPHVTNNHNNSPIKRLLSNGKPTNMETEILSKNNKNISDFVIPHHQKNLKKSIALIESPENKNEIKEANELIQNSVKSAKNNKTIYSYDFKKNNEEIKIPKKILNPLKTGEVRGIEVLNNIFPMSLFNNDELLKKEDLPIFELSKCSTKKNGLIKAYSANTHQGLLRNYNEDRVSIILNMVKPNSKKDLNWPLCSYFAIYDGHGGNKCAEFLRDNLHHYIVRDPNFPSDIPAAIRKGCELAEKTFLDQAKSGIVLEKSGSCAILALIVNDNCYIANVGDSRALMSADKGNMIIPLSRDHKPGVENEKSRILKAGGQIYQSQTQSTDNSGKTIFGPHRVLPGRLSVSRTFGDAEAKLSNYNGNPNVVIAEPEIKCFKINKSHDFIILGCDGIFDKISNKQVIRSMWEAYSKEKTRNLHEFSGKAVENMMREALLHKSLDNVTAVMISFKNLNKALFPKKSSLTRLFDKGGKFLLNKMKFNECDYIESKIEEIN